MPSSTAPSQLNEAGRLEAEGFYKLVMSARKLEWSPTASSDEIALYDREQHVTIVTDRRAFERLRESQAAKRAARQ